MGAIVAELHVDGRCFILTYATYGVSQATDGRVRERVRSGRLEVVLHVPADAEFLRAWAFNASKRYAVDVVFRDAAGGQAVETASLAEAYCVFYREDYLHGEGGYYTAELHLSDPTGLTMNAGGPGAAFVAPPAREYPYNPPTQLPGTHGTTARPFLKNGADPLHDVLGPGQSSHQQEWEQTIALLKKEGVNVVFRAGVMAYGPQPSSGKLGRLIIDPNASIGALRHEAQHFFDDKALGFPGMQGLFAAKTRWQMEYNAYMQEVRLARDLRAFPAGEQLVSNARAEKQFITKNYGPVK